MSTKVNLLRECYAFTFVEPDILKTLISMHYIEDSIHSWNLAIKTIKNKAFVKSTEKSRRDLWRCATT